MNILIISNQVPFPIHDGYTLRVFHLTRQLAKQHNCYLASFNQNSSDLGPLEEQKIFQEVELLPVNRGRPRLLRHFRLSEENFIELSYPQYFYEIVKRLEDLRRTWKIDGIVSFSELEFSSALEGLEKVVDICDCLTLFLERAYKQKRELLRVPQKIKSLLHLHRVRAQECKVCRNFKLITVISPVDCGRLKKLAGSNQENVVVVPNGVDPDLLLHTYKGQEIEKSIIFWGNLSFPPNYSAVEHFFKEVYEPYLAVQGVQWFIVGGNPSKNIFDLGKKFENIIVTGYKKDLYEIASRVPIMINPMIMGGGLKNKVLEAFALRRVVISNQMGIEAIQEAKSGVHYIQAESPLEFATAILDCLSDRKTRSDIGNNARKLVEDNYTWSKVGALWNASINSALTTKNA